MTGKVGLLDLPQEIVYDILDYLPSASLVNCVSTCTLWWQFLTAKLYASPSLPTTESYTIFVETILDRPELGGYVRVLDLARVIGTLKTIKLSYLMEACPNLTEFYAPQAAFTPHMMQVLPSLHHLRVLDLECCIERFEISRVINYCTTLTRLHTFRYPRCAVSTLYPVKQYPPALKHFALRGGLRDDFIVKMSRPSHPKLPVESLLIAYAPSITAPPMLQLISVMHTLQHLTVAWPIMRFSHNSFDSLLHLAPQLKYLSISIDYISARFFESPHANLETLMLNFSGVGKHRVLTAEDITDALEAPEHYPALSNLGISSKLFDLLFKDIESAESLRCGAMMRSITLHTTEDIDQETSGMM